MKARIPNGFDVARMRVWPYWAQLGIVAISYYVAGVLGLRVSLVGQSITPLWAPTGVAVVAFFVLGRRTWPAVAVAAFAINAPISPSIAAALLIAVGNTAAPIVAVALLHLSDFRPQLARVRDAAALVFLGAFVAMAISATIGTLALLWSDAIVAHNFAGAWSVWWTGDAMGVLIVAPFIWSLRPRTTAEVGHSLLETIGTGVLLCVACGIAFGTEIQLLFVVLPVVGIVAWRYGQRGAARASLVVSVAATIVVAEEAGSFAGLSLVDRMVTLQSFNATVALTSILLAAAVSQREDVAALQRDAVETLQRSLLPERLPSTPLLDFAARYVPSNTTVELGGDWYDVIELGFERYGFVVGDVVGHGNLAAAIMGKIRMALRAYALDGRSPADVLQRLNSLLRDVQDSAMATIWYGEFDAGEHRLTFTNAGHVPPLMMDALGSCYLDDVHGPPIGTVDHVQYAESCLSFRPDSTLLLYTDGLVERRNARIDDGLETLRTTVMTSETDLDATCDLVLATLAPEAARDDIALLAIRVRSLAGHQLRVDRLATSSVVPETRHLMQAWLNENCIDRHDAADILLATTEACANVVIHAYGLTGGPLHLTASLSHNEVCIVVRDEGVWRPPHATADGDGRGRGVTMMRSLMDSVEVKTNHGTEVRMRRTVHYKGT